MKWGELWESLAIGLKRSASDGGLGEFAIGNLLPETLAALFTFFVGWIVSVNVGKQRRKDRIIDELILSQRELVKRAYPDLFGEAWRMNDQRDAWMLDPYVARIEFLIASMREDRGLSLAEIDHLEHYVEAKRRFIERWAEVKYRTASYHDLYRVSYHALRAAVKALGLKKMKRLQGLMPKDDLLDGMQKETMAASPLFGGETATPSNGGLAPAE